MPTLRRHPARVWNISQDEQTIAHRRVVDPGTALLPPYYAVDLTGVVTRVPFTSKFATGETPLL